MKHRVLLVLSLVLLPFIAYADIVFEPGSASLRVEHAGTELTDAEWIDDMPPVLRGDELTRAGGEWEVSFLESWGVPAGRAAYVLARLSDLDAEIALEKSVVHAAIPDDGNHETAESQIITFDLAPFGDHATPSGYYKLLVVEYPETKLVCQDEEPFECFDEPYTQQDFLDWFYWRHEVDHATYEGEPMLVHDPAEERFITFEYIAGTAHSDTIDPVIVIPGILGSEQNSDGEWVIDPILHTYDDLIATLDVNHYTPGQDLFTFPYNWRKSNVETALLLKQKIDEIKGICACDKVDLVAHSMGGLVARQYIQSDAYEQDVDQLIFLGTPHLGAPKAYLMWEGGEVDPQGVENWVLQKMLEQEAYENGFPNLFSYIHNGPIPSVGELLPTYDYVFDGSDLRDYPSGYPVNVFLENLNTNVSNFLSSGVEVHNLVGNNHDEDTITAVTTADSNPHLPLWEHGYPMGFYENTNSRGLERGGGDSTVPIASASFIESNVFSLDSNHNSLPEDYQAKIYETLTSSEATTLVDDINLANIRLILIKMFSPADLLVIAPDGKKIGKENGASINQIQDAFYTGFNTETEFITILNPLDGEYVIKTEGIDSGAYTVETDYITEATTTSASYTGVTEPGETSELALALDSSEPGSLDLVGPDSAPPTIVIDSPEPRDYARSETVALSVTVEDPSGVASLETRLGTSTISIEETIDLFFHPLGSHTIHVSAVDEAGNATTTSVNFMVVATAASTVADFERVYAMGWMTKKVHDALAKKVKAIVVVKNGILSVIERKLKREPVRLESVLDKVAARAILKELDKHRGKGLDERAYQLLKEDILWLIN